MLRYIKQPSFLSERAGKIDQRSIRECQRDPERFGFWWASYLPHVVEAGMRFMPALEYLLGSPAGDMSMGIYGSREKGGKRSVLLRFAYRVVCWAISKDLSVITINKVHQVIGRKRLRVRDMSRWELSVNVEINRISRNAQRWRD
uniref:RNA-directed DNA polymerase n=1 Tax=Ascaris lumbricoides TaxID=6252 RepID=A0A0M3HX91_ASCLU